MIVLLGLSSCGDRTTTAVTLSNHSSQPVSGVSASFAGKIERVDKIVSGGSVMLASHTGGEGLACLSFLQGGAERHYIIDYMTEGMPTHYRVTIHDRNISVLSSERSDYSDGKANVHSPRSLGKKCPR